MTLALLIRDLKLAFTNFSQLFNQVIFLLISITIFSLGFENQIPENLKLPLMWFCLIFSSIIGIGNFLRDDFKDGTVEQIIINKNIVEKFVLLKITINWLLYSIPLILFIPIIKLIININNSSIYSLILFSSLVTFLINLIGCFCVILTLSISKNESLISILILPLIIPIIIFANNMHEDYTILFLTLISIFLTPILVYLGGLTLKLNLQ